MGCAALQNIDTFFGVCFHSEMRAVKQIISKVIEFLIDNTPSISEEDAFDLKLVYSELLVNAIIHGNKMNINKSVHMFVDVHDNMVHSVISDEGSGFDYNKILTGIKSNANLLGETGRGIRLACSLTDSLSFNRSGNEVTFYKYVGLD